MYKIAVVGDRDSIYGFAAIGMDIYPVTDATALVKKIKALTGSGYAVIYVTEEFYARLSEQEHGSDMLPAILPIPGISGNSDIGVARVKKLVEQAVGSDILFSNK
jgi:V/A-type H+-transporting ATPase subunit F